MLLVPAGPSFYNYAEDNHAGDYTADSARFDCESCLCAIDKAFAFGTDRSSFVSPTTGPLTLDRCALEAVDVLASVMVDGTVSNINSCLNLEADQLQRTLKTCRETSSGTVVSQRRSMLQANVVPGEVNQTATDVKSTVNNATATVQNSVNNATAGFNQLGDTSALNQASQSGNASTGEYVNAFVNDTNRALGVIGGVFKSSAEQPGMSKLFVVLAAAAMLGLPFLCPVSYL